jgi:hypothetical protein
LDDRLETVAANIHLKAVAASVQLETAVADIGGCPAARDPPYDITGVGLV